VVDDNQDIVDVFCELLNLIGLDVLAKGMDGMDAVKLYEKYRPDLIFVDLIMPKYDGFYAIENIKDVDPNAKIIVITEDVKNILGNFGLSMPGQARGTLYYFQNKKYIN